MGECSKRCSARGLSIELVSGMAISVEKGVKFVAVCVQFGSKYLVNVEVRHHVRLGTTPIQEEDPAIVGDNSVPRGQISVAEPERKLRGAEALENPG
jgi:hypothetical protein